VRENVLTTDDLIWPLFLIEGANRREPIKAMPGVERLTVDEVVREAERAAGLDIPRSGCFPTPDPCLRNARGSRP
jgi:porphobilinogen synthase